MTGEMKKRLDLLTAVAVVVLLAASSERNALGFVAIRPSTRTATGTATARPSTIGALRAAQKAATPPKKKKQKSRRVRFLNHLGFLRTSKDNYELQSQQEQEQG